MMQGEPSSASARLIEELEEIVCRLREEMGLGPSRLSDAVEKLRGEQETDE